VAIHSIHVFSKAKRGEGLRKNVYGEKNLSIHLSQRRVFENAANCRTGDYLNSLISSEYLTINPGADNYFWWGKPFSLYAQGRMVPGRIKGEAEKISDNGLAGQ